MTACLDTQGSLGRCLRKGPGAAARAAGPRDSESRAAHVGSGGQVPTRVHCKQVAGAVTGYCRPCNGSTKIKFYTGANGLTVLPELSVTELIVGGVWAMLVNKWFSLSAATLLQLSAGLVYTFSLFAPALKLAAGYDQVQLEGVGSAILSGGFLAWIPGLTYDALLQRHYKLAPR